MRAVQTSVLAISLLMSAAPAALAQATGGSAGDKAVSEIIVTAQRREENLQQVPIAVNAVSGADLHTANVQSVYDLTSLVPSFTLQNTNGLPQPRLRGLGNSGNGPGVENAVATYMDGFYIASSTAILDYNDIQRLEILKGPQGTLFGRNATAGVLQLVTRDPSDKFQGSTNVGYGAYAALTGNLYVTGPITDHLTADLAVHIGTQGEGYGKNLFNGQDLYRVDRDNAVRSKWKLDLGSTTIKLLFDAASRLSSDPAFQEKNGTSIAAQPNVIANFSDPYDGNYDIQPLHKAFSEGVGLTIEHDFGPVTLTSLTGARRNNYHNHQDSDQTPLAVSGLDYSWTDKQASEELQLSNNNPGRLKWLVGAYFFDLKAAYPYLNIFTVNSPQNIDISGGTEAKSSAGFAQATLELITDTNLTVGARYSTETRSFNATETLTSATGVPTVLLFSPHDLKFSQTTWRVALDHKFNENIMGYLSYNTGFKSGGFNVISPSAPGFLPEELDASEAGLKSELFDRRLRLNGAIFYYKYNNIQQQALNAAVGPLPYVYNAAQASEYGLDLDFDFRATEALTITGGADLIHDRFDSFPGALIGVFDPVARHYVQSPGSATGHSLPYAPKASVQIGLDYAIESVFGGRMNLAVKDRYNSGYFFAADNVLSQSAFSMVDASARWTAPDDRFNFEVWGKNLTDRHILDGASDSTVVPVSYFAPRTYGVTLGVNF